MIYQMLKRFGVINGKMGIFQHTVNRDSFRESTDLTNIC